MGEPSVTTEGSAQEEQEPNRRAGAPWGITATETTWQGLGEGFTSSVGV